MYIISKYKDYYDGAVGMGIDKTIVYNREFRSMETPQHIADKLLVADTWSRPSFTHSYYMDHDIPDGKYSTYLVIVGFCGKIYPALKTITMKKFKGNWDRTRVVDIIYGKDQIKEFLDKHYEEKRNYGWGSQTKTDVQRFEDYLQTLKGVESLEWHRELDSPIFVYGRPPLADQYDWVHYRQVEDKHGLFINPLLKDYKFAKVFDPYTAFQELQMFISGVMPTGDNVEQLPATEKQKVAQHGMDKWSFRKPPSK